MARCKNIRPRRTYKPRASRKNLRVITPPPAEPLITMTPRTEVLASGSNSPPPQMPDSGDTIVEENGTSPRTAPSTVSPTKKEKQQHKKRDILPKEKREPFLPSYRVGNVMVRPKLALPGSTTKIYMAYCLDCIRTHQYLYCNGDSESRFEMCEYHKEK
jgi:hypothetical protein